MHIYRDRKEAGILLGERLARFAEEGDSSVSGLYGTDPLVLGLPRGGVVVAFEVAKALGAELDVVVVRKLGVPGMEELAFGAVAPGGVRVLLNGILESHGITKDVVELVTEREKAELERRQAYYREEREPAKVQGRSVVLVDDGLATGATMWAALRAVGARAPARLIVAVPLGTREAIESLDGEGGDVPLSTCCLATPEPFGGVGRWYRDFTQTGDEEVRSLLRRARELRRA